MGRSVAEMQAHREEKMCRIIESKLFKSREVFTPSTLAREMEGETPDTVSWVLEWMWREGHVSKRIKEGKAFYSAKPKSILSVDWRVDLDVHRMIEELNRGW